MEALEEKLTYALRKGILNCFFHILQIFIFSWPTYVKSLYIKKINIIKILNI